MEQFFEIRLCIMSYWTNWSWNIILQIFSFHLRFYMSYKIRFLQNETFKCTHFISAMSFWTFLYNDVFVEVKRKKKIKDREPQLYIFFINPRQRTLDKNIPISDFLELIHHFKFHDEFFYYKYVYFRNYPKFHRFDNVFYTVSILFMNEFDPHSIRFCSSGVLGVWTNQRNPSIKIGISFWFLNVYI